MQKSPALSQAHTANSQQHTDYIAIPETSGQETSLHHYFSILKRRKWILFIPFSIIFIFSLILIAFQNDTYVAQATILINDVKPKVVPVQEIITPETSPDYYNTEYEMIKRREIVEKVVDLLHLDATLPPQASPMAGVLSSLKGVLRSMFNEMKSMIRGIMGQSVPTPASPDVSARAADPAELHRQNTIQDLQARLQVKPREGTKLVDIILSGSDPVGVIEQVNTVAEVYVAQNLESNREASRQAIAWLQEEAASLQQKTTKAELALDAFKQGKDFIPIEDLGQQQNTTLHRLDTLNASYVETNTARLQLGAQIDELKKLSRQDIEEVLKFPVIGGAPLIASLKNRYFELKVQLANLSNTFMHKHPSVVQVQAQIKEAAQAIRSEIQTMLNQLNKEHDTLLAREATLKGEIEAEKEKVQGFSGDVRKYNALQRDLDIDRDLFLTVSKRLAESTLTAALTTNNIRIVERALQSKPSSQTIKTLTLNILLGLCFGVGLAVLTEYLDKRFKTADEAEQYLAIPFLGVIPRHKIAGHRGQPIALREPRSHTAEAYRSLRTWVELSALKPVQTLLVTSAAPGEGKSTTAANLAVSFAQLGRSVLLVDTDLRRPTLHRAFGRTNTTGLTDVLVRGADWRQVIQETDLDNLKLLSAGFIPPNPVELLSTQRLTTLIAHFKEAFDCVIFDAPIVLSIPDVVILAPRMDGVLFVQCPAMGDRDIALQAKRLLERTAATLVGVVFNNVSQKQIKYYTHRYHYQYRPSTTWPTSQNAAGGQFLDMRPLDDNSRRLDSPLASNRHMTAPLGIERTSQSASLAITVQTVQVQPSLSSEQSEHEDCFLILRVVLWNEAEVPYTFLPEHTAVYLNKPHAYSSALASVVPVPGIGSNASRQEIRAYRYDPARSQVDGGIGAEVTIPARDQKQATLVYQVTVSDESYLFEYNSGDIHITIPLSPSQ